MGQPALIDLLHLGRPRVLAAYLVADPEPTLIDCGPVSCLGALERALGDRGLRIGELRHLLLTHIHLDHAGAAGALVARSPRLTVHVSEAGAPTCSLPSASSAVPAGCSEPSSTSCGDRWPRFRPPTSPSQAATPPDFSASLPPATRFTTFLSWAATEAASPAT